jgi:hypothetical protein
MEVNIPATAQLNKYTTGRVCIYASHSFASIWTANQGRPQTRISLALPSHLRPSSFFLGFSEVLQYRSPDQNNMTDQGPGGPPPTPQDIPLASQSTYDVTEQDYSTEPGDLSWISNLLYEPLDDFMLEQTSQVGQAPSTYIIVLFLISVSTGYDS